MAVRLDKIDYIWQESKDNKVLQILSEAERDKINVPREVIHFLYFNSKINRDRCSIRLKYEGFKILSQNKGDNSYSLILKHNEAPSKISKTTFFLLEISYEFNGEYDGWETCFLKSVFN